MEIVSLVAGVLVGVVLGWAAARARGARVEAERAVLAERLAAVEAGRDEAHALEVTVAPLAEALAKVEVQLQSLESTRIRSHASLAEQVSLVRSSNEALRDQTTALVTALRAPQTRGRWGEMQLRRVVELAGMVEHCDFTEQATASRDGSTLRPDLVVRLAGGKHVVVDAKVSLAAYLDAVESKDADVTAQRMAAHARHLREHVKGLAAKEYWRSFEPTPEFVVLFVPGDAFLAPALDRDPALLEDAMAARVLIATPTTLMAMLRTIAYSWQQEALADNARTVFELGRELHRRLSTLGGHVDKLGRTLGRAVADYNAAVGSLERNVLVTARRMAELQVTDADLPRLTAVEEVPRPLAAPELTAALGELVGRPVPDAAEILDDTADRPGSRSHPGRLPRAQ